MTRSKSHKARIRQIKDALRNLTDAELVNARHANDRETRKAAKAILLERYRPTLPTRFEALNHRPGRGASEELWNEWRAEWSAYIKTAEYRDTIAAIAAADARVNALLGETDATPQAGIAI